jgi:hypothetical protein
MIAAMGTRAYRGGMIDYCAVVWDVRHPTAPGETRTIWLPLERRQLMQPITQKQINVLKVLANGRPVVALGTTRS